MFDRGFTGQEHLDAFNLINMNGRVYDPEIGMFLRPDNNIQDPGKTQNYNRYAYCLFNPFRYTDPSGDDPTPLNGCTYTWDGLTFGSYDDMEQAMREFEEQETHAAGYDAAYNSIVSTMIKQMYNNFQYDLAMQGIVTPDNSSYYGEVQYNMQRNYGQYGDKAYARARFEQFTGESIKSQPGNKSFHPWGWRVYSRGILLQTIVAGFIEDEKVAASDNVAANGGGGKVDLLNSTNIIGDLFGRIKYLNSEGKLNNLNDIVLKNKYANVSYPVYKYKNYIMLNGYEYKIEIRYPLDNVPNSYYNVYQMGFGFVNRFQSTHSSLENEGYYQGFFMIGYNGNYLIQIGAKTNKAFNYLHSLFYEK